MPMNLTKGRSEEFIAALKKVGGSAGNRGLRQALGWDEEFYWKVQGLLISEGRIVTGRGYGGSVRLAESHVLASGGRSLPLLYQRTSLLRKETFMLR